MPEQRSVFKDPSLSACVLMLESHHRIFQLEDDCLALRHSDTRRFVDSSASGAAILICCRRGRPLLKRCGRNSWRTRPLPARTCFDMFGRAFLANQVSVVGSYWSFYGANTFGLTLVPCSSAWGYFFGIGEAWRGRSLRSLLGSLYLPA
jgi:hypothetical protein